MHNMEPLQNVFTATGKPRSQIDFLPLSNSHFYTDMYRDSCRAGRWEAMAALSRFFEVSFLFKGYHRTLFLFGSFVASFRFSKAAGSLRRKDLKFEFHLFNRSELLKCGRATGVSGLGGVLLCRKQEATCRKCCTFTSWLHR